MKNRSGRRRRMRVVCVDRVGDSGRLALATPSDALTARSYYCFLPRSVPLECVARRATKPRAISFRRRRAFFTSVFFFFYFFPRTRVRLKVISVRFPATVSTRSANVRPLPSCLRPPKRIVRHRWCTGFRRPLIGKIIKKKKKETKIGPNFKRCRAPDRRWLIWPFDYRESTSPETLLYTQLRFHFRQLARNYC